MLLAISSMLEKMKSSSELKDAIEKNWVKYVQDADVSTDGVAAIHDTIQLLDKGIVQICQKQENGNWDINEWIKKAILLFFKISDNKLISCNGHTSFDKIHSKFQDWTNEDFNNANIRVVPGSFARYGSFIGERSILMSASFINIGVNIGSKTMIDANTTVGSCAIIGNSCHISSQVCIGGVLEPLQAKPVIIEDNCFIGTGSTITEGVIIKSGAVIASGVHLTGSTKIYNRQTGQYVTGIVPENSVVVSGTYNTLNNLNIQCAIIIKTIDAAVKAKTSINELLRDNTSL